MLEKQRQEAGDNSQQIQAGTVIINSGIDEKRAREIVDEKLHEVIGGYTQEAREIAKERIDIFANDLIPKLVKNNLLEALKDPSIQILLSEAQKSAASTERIADYELLSELLIHRVKNGLNRNIWAGINRAVKIVDEITDESLLGVTVAYSVLQWIPASGNLYEGLNTLNTLFGKIIYEALPKGSEWIEHLDVLGVIRINSFGSLKKIGEFYPEVLSGYVDVGIDKTSENYQKAIEIIKEAHLPNNILCDHELRSGFVRLQIVRIDKLDLLSVTGQQKVNIGEQEIILPINQPLTDHQKDAIKNIYALYNNEFKLKSQNISKFIEKWDEYDNLRNLKSWWDEISLSYTITPVGRVLAHANAQRCDSSLPALD